MIPSSRRAGRRTGVEEQEQDKKALSPPGFMTNRHLVRVESKGSTQPGVKKRSTDECAKAKQNPVSELTVTSCTNNKSNNTLLERPPVAKGQEEEAVKTTQARTSSTEATKTSDNEQVHLELASPFAAPHEWADGESKQDETTLIENDPKQDREEMNSDAAVDVASTLTGDTTTIATPIPAEVVPSQQEIEDRLAQRIQQEIASQVEKSLPPVATVRAVPEQEITDIETGLDPRANGEQKARIWYQRKWTWIGMGALFLLIIGGVIGGVVGANKEEGADPTQPPTYVPTTPAPTTQEPTMPPKQTEEFYAIRDAMAPVLGPLYNWSLFDDSSSVQYQALDWMANVDPYTFDNMITAEENLLVERYVAVLLYFSLRGHDWTHRLQFLSPSRVCTWSDNGATDYDGNAVERGIFCDDDKSIIGLDLTSNGLHGKLPDEIGYLTNLRQLAMDYNFKHFGRLTKAITRLDFLETCWFRDNALSGPVHTEFGAMTNLFSLDLGENDFTGIIPSEIGSIHSLLYLLMDGNQGMEGSIPSQLGNLSNLRMLTLDNIGLNDTIPSELGSIGESLETLYLSSNRLAGPLPSELGRLVGLRNLALHDNPTLNGAVPVDYAGMVNLEYVLLYATALTASLDNVWCSNPAADISNWEIAYADCAGSPPEIECTCCTHCCDPYYICEANGVL